MRSLTVSIVTFNGAGVIKACLQSLHAQTYTDFDTVILDNASSDGTLAEVTNTAPEARQIVLHENVGFGAGHNQVIRATQTPYVLVLNQDVVLEPTAIERLISAAKSSKAAATGPLLIRPDAGEVPTIDTAGLVKKPWWSVQDRGSGKALILRFMQSGFLWGVSGACMLLRRDVLERIAYLRPDGSQEYFDEAFFMYKEDVDLCARLHQAGEQIWFEGLAVGKHARTGRRGRRAQLPQYVREYSYRNHWWLLMKHAWFWQWPLIAPYEAIKFLWVVFREPKTLRVIPDIWANIPLMCKRRYAKHR